MMRKAIATAPGQPTEYVDLTTQEESRRQADAQAHINRPPPIPKFDGIAKALEQAPDWAAAKGLIAQWLRDQ